MLTCFCPVIALTSLDRRQKPLFDIIRHADIGIGRVRVDPGHDKKRVALFGDPLDQAVLFLEIENVEFVDPGRENHQRDFVHLLGAWRILDQFHHPVAIDHLARGRGDILAQLKRLFIGQTHDHLALVRLEISNQVFQVL